MNRIVTAENNSKTYDSLIKENFHKLITERESLLEAINFYKQVTGQKRHMKFTYFSIFPLYSENDWKIYIYETIKKAIEHGEIVYNHVNLVTISTYIFDADPHYGRWSKKYPQLYELINFCFSKINNSREEFKKYKQISPEIEKSFISSLDNKKTLIEPIEQYLLKEDNLVLNYIENVLIPTYGEEDFLIYIKEMINQFTKIEELTSQVSPSKLSKYIFDIDCCSSKWNERHTYLFDFIIKGIGTSSIKKQLTNFENFNETEITQFFTSIIEKEFFSKRKRLKKTEFYRLLLGTNEINDSSLKTFKYYQLIDDIFEEKFREQRKYFIETNKDELDLHKDEWILFYEDGASLRSKTFKFNNINSQTIKTELKLFIKNNYIYSDIVKLFHIYFNSKRALNILIKKFKIKYFKDIESFHLGFLLQQLQVDGYTAMSIKNSFQALSKISNHLINLKNYRYSPDINIFTLRSFHNISSMTKNTNYIPDEVINQIELHINELNNTHQLIYEIFSATGMRAKEVLRLEYDCCYPKEEYEGFIKLEYIPHKIRKARKKRSLPEKTDVYITNNLYEKIIMQCENSKRLREEFDSPYIFITKHNAEVVSNGNSGFCRAINRIIKKYNICDLEGNQWHFTSRQMRKTLVVQLIENNATPHQVATLLNHLNDSTTEQFYIEVKMKKLAELNTEFFNKKFKFVMGEETLKLYTEEERKQLYIDFCLNKREVEFGQCTKHMSEGKCSKRTGKYNCAICPKLCTGIKYLNKWESLRKSQHTIVAELIRIYKKHGFTETEYTNFTEYRREKFLLECYTEVITKIRKKE